jgi:hypothetical protein
VAGPRRICTGFRKISDRVNQLTDTHDKGRMTYAQAILTHSEERGLYAIWLPDVGIKGNRHTMMAERSNEQIADLIESWIRQRVRGVRGGTQRED